VSNIKPKLLDLYCKAGGSSMGYYRAGFEVTGVDIQNQRKYPFVFIKSDVREVLRDHKFLKSFDAIAASPPCQLFSQTKHLRDSQGKDTNKINMIPETIEGLMMSGKPWIVENVPGAPLDKPVQVCGSAFGMKIRRHRLFQSNVHLVGTSCYHSGITVGVYGQLNDRIPNGGRTAKDLKEAREVMGIDWMPWTSLVEAIPPNYTEYLGKQLMSYV
jgi:DNA (cytosine-5)-methyltransferase 1